MLFLSNSFSNFFLLLHFTIIAPLLPDSQPECEPFQVCFFFHIPCEPFQLKTSAPLFISAASNGSVPLTVKNKLTCREHVIRFHLSSASRYVCLEKEMTMFHS